MKAVVIGEGSGASMETIMYSAGETWTEPPNSHHIVTANASKTEPARLMAYVIADDGVPATVHDK